MIVKLRKAAQAIEPIHHKQREYVEPDTPYQRALWAERDTGPFVPKGNHGDQ